VMTSLSLHLILALFVFFYFICNVHGAVTRLNIGGSLQMSNPIISFYKDKSVGVITAAGSPSDANEIIREIRQRGAKSVEWLPIQAPCRRFLNDTATITKIRNLDALYFTGGYPNRLHACLYGDTNAPNDSNPLLEAIKERPLLGGSSAGSLVQPRLVILTTGFPSSYDTLTRGSIDYNNRGCLFIKENVLVDVHFSERGRQGRLHVLQHTTKPNKLPMALGIDEDTTIVSHDNNTFTVVGRGGVYLQNNIDKEHSIFSYLTEDDEMLLNPDGKVTVRIASYKGRCPTSSNAPTPSTRIFAPNAFTNIVKNLATYQNVSHTVTSVEGSRPVVQVDMTKTEQGWCGEKNGRQYISLLNFKVRFQVRSAKDVGYIGEEPFPADSWQIED
jgi:cyanophycinase